MLSATSRDAEKVSEGWEGLEAAVLRRKKKWFMILHRFLFEGNSKTLPGNENVSLAFSCDVGDLCIKQI